MKIPMKYGGKKLGANLSDISVAQGSMVALEYGVNLSEPAM